MTESCLLGTWSLVAWYNEALDGTRFYPLGHDVKGYISYTPDGYVFVQISAANRPHYAQGDPFGGTADEDMRAIKSQITYAGSFEDRGGQVIHRVTQASFPNWVGTDQVRDVRFEGDRLHLSAKGAVFQGHEVTAFLEWQRAV